MKTMVDYLNNTVKNYPDKPAFVDENRSMTFSEMDKESMCIAESIIEKKLDKAPIIIFIGKTVEYPSALVGIARSGNFCVSMDVNMPTDRLIKLVDTIEPKLIIADYAHMDSVNNLIENRKLDVIIYEEALKVKVDENKVREVESKVKPQDIISVVYSSGSTGVPKAIILNHGYINTTIDWQVGTLPFDSDSICGDLVPMHYSVFHWYFTITLVHGATTYLIPQGMIKEPTKLMQYLFDNKVSLLIWVPTALGIISEFDCFDKPYLPDLKVVAFVGEPMIGRHMNRWRAHYKNTKFFALFTSSECVYNELIYEVDKDFPENSYVSIAKKENSSKVLLINADGKIASKGEEAEVYFRIYVETYGYYKDSVKTNECFVMNPIDKNDKYKYFKSGDIVKINDDDEIVYVSRNDSQIKYLGNRINLGEIEAATIALDGIKRCMAVYNQDKKQIDICYVGEMKERDVFLALEKAIPKYMMPKRVVKLDSMPLNSSGKLDRNKVKDLFK